MGMIGSYQIMTEKKVDRLISVAEVQYNALSSVTFTYVGRYANVLEIKSRHDRISYLAYGKARELNKIVGGRAKAVISIIEKPEQKSEGIKALRQKVLSSVSNTAQLGRSSLVNSLRNPLEKILG